MTLILRDYQQKSIDSLFQWLEQNSGNPCLVLPTGCHSAGTKILMHNGSMKNVEDIVIGDKVMGPDGGPRNIIDLHRGYDEMYDIIPVKGDTFTVNKDHILSLQQTGLKSNPKYKCQEGKGLIVNIPVGEYINKTKHFKHVHKLYRTGCISPWNEVDNFIPPYILGLLIGDGSFKYGYVGLTSIDTEIISEWSNYIKSLGLSVRIDKGDKKSCPTYVASSGRGGKRNGNYILEYLREIGIHGLGSEKKYIPNRYKINSVKNRLELLAGLIDSDGSLDRNVFDYMTKSEKLADDICFLSRSLGLAAYKSECLKSCKNVNYDHVDIYYRVCISGNIDIVPCRLERKKPTVRKQIKSVLRTGFKVKYSHYDKYFGFEVDNDNLYVMGDFTVTHNSGKSILNASLCNSVYSGGCRVMSLTHIKELTEQNANAFNRFYPLINFGIHAAGMNRYDINQDVMFCGIQSVYKKAQLLGHFDTVIIDEAHTVNHKQTGCYRKFIDDLLSINPKLRIIGLTATPYRLGHGYISDGDETIFDDIIEPVEVTELIDSGYLSKLRSKCTDTIYDVSKVKKNNGDYNRKDLELTVNTNRYNDSISREIIARAGDRKHWLIFCSGIQHAKDMAQSLNEFGIKSAYLTGKNTKAEREKIISDFKSGEIKALTNAEILTTGFDFPNIDLIAMLRPTASPGLYIQIVGRGLRLKDHTDHCLILDFAGNVRRHGPITDVTPPKKRSRSGEAPVKLCEQCSEILHLSVMRCPECGFEFPKLDKTDQLRLHQDCVLGYETIDIEVTHWLWSVHSKNGTDMLKVQYYSGDAFDDVVTEYLTILHPGWPGKNAIKTLKFIAKKAEVDIYTPSTLSDLCINLNSGFKPDEINYKMSGKYPVVISRIWGDVPF